MVEHKLSSYRFSFQDIKEAGYPEFARLTGAAALSVPDRDAPRRIVRTILSLNNPSPERVQFIRLFEYKKACVPLRLQRRLHSKR